MHPDPLVFLPVPCYLVFWGPKFLGIRGHLDETWQTIGVDGQFSISKTKLCKNLHVTTCHVTQYKYCCLCSVTCIRTLYLRYMVDRSKRGRGLVLAPQSPSVPVYNGNISSWKCPDKCSLFKQKHLFSCSLLFPYLLAECLSDKMLLLYVTLSKRQKIPPN